MKSPEELKRIIQDLAIEYSQTKQKPYISILQPRRNFKEIPAQQLQNWQNRMIDMSSIAVSFHAIDQNPVDSARCYLMDRAIEDDAKYALFIDEDTVLPYNAVQKLLKTSREHPDAIITGIYYVKFGNPMLSIEDENGRWVMPEVTPNTGLIRNVVNNGLGCALIPLSIIKKIRHMFEDIPLFCIVPEGMWGNNKIKFLGEDTWFYMLAKKAGIEVIADTSVHCLHMELATGKYSAHPDVNLEEYVTNIPITTPLTLADRDRVSFDYNNRLCQVPIDVSNQALDQLYIDRCNDANSNINEHLPTLKKYAEECTHVTEMGTEHGNSLIALMNALPKKLISIDRLPLTKYNIDPDQLIQLAASYNVELEIITSKTSDVEIEETDLLFIDTEHTYECLSTELKLHANKVNKYIILHDTTTYGGIGEFGGRGLMDAVTEFLGENSQWTIHEQFENNNGLLVLKRTI